MAASDVRVLWQDSEGNPYGTFDSLSAELAGKGLQLRFAMNGGMYEKDLRPVGLLIVDGRTLEAANARTLQAGTKPVPNFYKKPNGVFYVGKDGAGTMTTDRFLKEHPAADYATQSGPMLVIDGAIHPAFIPGSTDLNRRDGVGVCKPGEVTFAISEDEVNFDDFAHFFQERLGCRDALFLDGGSAPGIFAPDLGRDDPPAHGGYGPIIAVVGKNQ